MTLLWPLLGNAALIVLWGAFLVGAKVSDRTAFVRDWAYQQGMADMYATKAELLEHWKAAVTRPSVVAGVAEAEGRHAVSRAALESPTDVFNVIMHREFIQDGAE